MKNRNAWYGCRRDTRDARDRVFHPMAMRLPPAIDLRPHCPPVLNQGQLGSCTAHGITGALRYLLINASKPDEELARLQLYYDERAMEGTVREDAGAEIRDGIKSVAKIGIAHEALWPYVTSKFRSKPPTGVYQDAMKFHALTYERVSIDATQIKLALAQSLPVVIGVTLYASFESDAVAKTGVVPMPDLHHEAVAGGHCMYVVGYGQKPGMFTVRNSWAADWGDNGDCYFPEAYLGSPDFGSDYWVIKAAGPIVRAP